MFARLFSCCGKTKKEDIELVEGLLSGQKGHTDRATNCSFNHYTLYSELSWNIIKTTTSTFISNANLLTYLADLPPEYFGLNSTAALVSLPLAVLLGICEGYAHYQQSKNLDEVMHDIETGLDPASETRLPSVTWKQGVGSTIHYLSDVLSDAAGFLAFMQVGGADQFSLLARWGFSSAVLTASANGNLRELTNTITAAKLRNAREEREASHSLRASIS
jgi:hypothetical protein